MGKKREFTEEEVEYLKNNFRTTTNTEMGKKLGIPPKAFYRILKRLGLKREPEDIQRVISARDKSNNGAEKRRAIEGGGRSNYKAMWHKSKWILENGPIPTDKILFYSAGNYDNFEDLILIHRKDFDILKRRRDREISKREKEARAERRRLEKEKRKLSAEYAEKKRILWEKEKERIEKNLDEIRKNPFRQIEIEREKGNVPVRIDDHTVVYIKRERCERLENGNYILKPGEELWRGKHVSPLEKFAKKKEKNINTIKNEDES